MLALFAAVDRHLFFATFLFPSSLSECRPDDTCPPPPQAANVSNPTVVEGLQGKYIVAIACGWHHTAGAPSAPAQDLMVCELNAHRSAY